MQHLKIGPKFVCFLQASKAHIRNRIEVNSEQSDQYYTAAGVLNLGRLAFIQGDEDEALRLLEKSLALSHVLGDTSNIAWTLLYLGRLELSKGKFASARVRLEEGLSLLRVTGDRSASAYALTLLGQVALQQGKMDEASARLKESVRLYREEGNRWGEARSLLLLAHLSALQGDTIGAQARYEESLSVAIDLSLKGFIVSGLKGVGIVVAARGQYAWAVRLWGAAEPLREARDVSIPAAIYEQAVREVRKHLGEQAFSQARDQGQGMSPQVIAFSPFSSPCPHSTPLWPEARYVIEYVVFTIPLQVRADKLLAVNSSRVFYRQMEDHNEYNQPN